jgi:hypothetical protein
MKTADDPTRERAIKHTRRALEALELGYGSSALTDLNLAVRTTRQMIRERDPNVGPDPAPPPLNYTHDEAEAALRAVCTDALRTIAPSYLQSLLESLAADMRALAQQEAGVEAAFLKFCATIQDRPIGEFAAFKGGWKAAHGAPVADPSLPLIYEARPTLHATPFRGTHAACKDWVMAVDGQPLIVVSRGESRTVGHATGYTIKPA